MKNIPDQIRQGDVFSEAVDEVPSGAKPLKPEGDRVVLAYGEVSGHAHVLPAAKVLQFRAGDDVAVGASYIEVKTPCALTHEEHAPIDLPKGTRRVTIQREYSPEAIRNVQD